jgi:hypothetical protein
MYLQEYTQVDYKRWDRTSPAESAMPRERSIPAQPFQATTDYSANYTDKQATRPVPHKRTTAPCPDLPFSGCTTYGKEYTSKAIPPRYNACLDRPWMRCDSCKPFKVATPNSGEESTLQGELTWTNPPYARARAELDDRTAYKTSFQTF